MTHGERWIAKAYLRIAGYCKTRGWTCGPARRIGRDQHEVWIGDRLGREGVVVFDPDGGSPALVDALGFRDECNAVNFDALIAVYGLAGKPLVSKRQLSFVLEGSAP